FAIRDPPAPSQSLDDASLSPEATASFLSRLSFVWIWPLLTLGYARPLEATDLWKLQDERSAAVVAAKIEQSFSARAKLAEQYNAALAAGNIAPSRLQRSWWALRGQRDEREARWREASKQSPSLALALSDAVTWWFWSAGILKFMADLAQNFAPLVVRTIITFATESYIAHAVGGDAPGIGKGIGFAFLLIALQIIMTLCSNHFMYRAASTGVLLRGGLINAIYTRSLRFTTRSRSKLSSGKLTNLISTDVSRIDTVCLYFHMSWAAVVQLAICIGLLIHNLGPSALAGFGFFIFASLPQGIVLQQMLATRRKVVVWTDKRARLLQELFSGIKLVKLFAWEGSFLGRVQDIRSHEMGYIRALIIIRSSLLAMVFSLPTLASIISFITYSASGHELNAAVIFSSLTLYQLLQTPLIFLPIAMSTMVDASNALGRIREVFTAELVTDSLAVDTSLTDGIRVEKASFTWDSAAPPTSQDTAADEKEKPEEKTEKKKGKKEDKKDTSDAEPPAEPAKEEPVFELKDVDFTVARGKLVAIVGAVGSGKSSLLQALIGEMRRTAGSVTFGGSIAYCSQVPWIQNATIRENICFGRPFEAERYWKAVKDACLESDLDVLPSGDMTEVGEKGIQLSGGQKQRINICRAIYSDADILIFDDPLSALDAHVGETVFNRVLADATSGKTRLLVTHALHFLRRADYVYALVDGHIAEQGTYSELMDARGTFAKHIDEFVSDGHHTEAAEADSTEITPAEDAAKLKREAAVKGDALMQEEDRATGAVSWSVYREYVNAGYGWACVPLVVAFLIFEQGATIVTSYWLVWWQDQAFNKPNGFYMGVYAALGVSQALGAFMVGVAFAMLSYVASKRLHHQAIQRVMHAPMSWFESTPLGRILNRFAKDIDTMDNQLVDALRTFFTGFMGMIGAVVLISIVLPWFLIGVAVIAVLYGFVTVFYRASAREVKRLEAVLRSSVYAHFSESMSGIGTIRAYGEEARFCAENTKRMDVENRAYWMTVTNQRWLGLWLDWFGVALTTVVVFLIVGTRFTITPARTGLVLSYVVSLQATLAYLITLLAEVENNMNSVERVVHYARNIEQEPAHEIPERTPAAPWPSSGALEIRDVVFKYRPELPAVLQGINLSVRPGERIGFVGRTGAGKTSLLTTLFRLVELTSGSITVDGVDISTLGLNDLRKNIAIIPQESTLFQGTLRSNLDPFDAHDDARLWDALRRSYLVDSTPKPDEKTEKQPGAASVPAAPQRFTLDSTIDDEGANISIGQRSLVSLARALVKDSKVLVLDEATASVDYETDRKIQETIAREFNDRTILCIAHRLRTIIAYDRICVLELGEVAELDTPANLFSAGGIFYGMCERSGITLEDIHRAAEHRRALESGAVR
ncbi:ABC transporter, partial [Peniophora sp. CONT]